MVYDEINHIKINVLFVSFRYSPNFLKKTKMVPLNLARQRYPRPSLDALKKAFNNSLSFLIVRHPLERLLSAYRDKLQHSLPHTYHRKLGNEIIMKYRKNAAKVRKLSSNTQSFFSIYNKSLVGESFLKKSCRNGKNKQKGCGDGASTIPSVNVVPFL